MLPSARVRQSVLAPFAFCQAAVFCSGRQENVGSWAASDSVRRSFGQYDASDPENRTFRLMQRRLFPRLLETIPGGPAHGPHDFSYYSFEPIQGRVEREPVALCAQIMEIADRTRFSRITRGPAAYKTDSHLPGATWVNDLFVLRFNPYDRGRFISVQ